MLNVFTTVEFQVVEFSVVSQNWLIWLYLLLNSTNSWPQGTGLAPRSICSPVSSPRLLYHDVRLAIGYVSTRELNEIGSGIVIRSLRKLKCREWELNELSRYKFEPIFWKTLCFSFDLRTCLRRTQGLIIGMFAKNLN